MRPMVKIEALSKRYLIGGLHPGYMTFREMVADTLFAPFRALRGMASPAREVLWALKGIDLEVQHGELIGIIGRNGAGKSTLLKILSRITKPTTGRIAIYGRIGSLLEVGTGFHPDLTGRENIFLNGAILGMRRAEIARKFDEIVSFSEIEKFIDTPVKWYSSGMYLRLAFSVAVHLDTEVLIMDEVLAVGDVSFQQKCLDRIHEIRNQGRTILFVSHSMAAVTRLCSRAILLEKGHLIADGPASEVVNDYLGSSWKVTSEREWTNLNDAPGNEVVRLRSVRVRDETGHTLTSIDIRRPLGVEIVYEVLQPGYTLTPKIELFNENGAHLFSAHDVGDEWRYRSRPIGLYSSTARIPGNFLAEGNMLASALLMSHIPETITHAQAINVVTFQVVDNQEKDSARGDFLGPITGMIRPLLNWTTEYHRIADEQLEEVISR